jgi:RND family efflux transporter MFP subunit
MSAPLFTVQQVTPVKLLVGISESEYTKIRKGDKVSITVDAIPGQEFSGKVDRLYPTIDPATHTFKAEVVVPNTDRVLRPGMYARVTVNFGTRRSIIVPDTALVKQEGTGTRFIYVLRADNTVSYLPVTVGRHMGQEYEVLSGLEEGARVVVKGQALLRDGVKVSVL